MPETAMPEMSLSPEAAPPKTRRRPNTRRRGKPETVKRSTAKRSSGAPLVFRIFVPNGEGGWAEVADAQGRSCLTVRLLCAARALPVPVGPSDAQF